MKTELIEEIQRQLKAIEIQEQKIECIKEFYDRNILANVFDHKAELKAENADLDKLKEKYNELTIKLTELNY